MRHRPRAWVTAVVPAAGVGRRAGRRDKLLQRINGTPILIHALRRLARAGALRDIVLVARPADHARIRRLLQRYRVRRVTRIVPGGATRMASVRRGLSALPASTTHVAIHDAARACVAPQLVARVVRMAQRTGAAIVAMPATDTTKLQMRRGRRGARLQTLPRRRLWLAQTPQVFERRLIERAYAAAARAGVTVTDDAAAVERLGRSVALVPSDARNVKITWPTDFVIAAHLLRRSARPHHLSGFARGEP